MAVRVNPPALTPRTLAPREDDDEELLPPKQADNVEDVDDVGFNEAFALPETADTPELLFPTLALLTFDGGFLVPAPGLDRDLPPPPPAESAEVSLRSIALSTTVPLTAGSREELESNADLLLKGSFLS